MRIFSVYGPGLCKQIFWDIYQKATQFSRIDMFGSGNESRDFIYIDDLVRAIDLIIQNKHLDISVINVANGEEVKIKNVVEIFIEHYNKKLSANFNGRIRQGDPINWRADIKKISALGYKREISLETGILNYIKWLKELE